MFTIAFDTNRTIVGYFLLKLVSFSLKANFLWDFNVLTPKPKTPSRKTIIICNHASFADVILLAKHIPFNVKYVAKHSLVNIPFFGIMMVLSGHITVKHKNKESIKSAMKLCQKYLDSNMPVVFFPEGRRSMDGSIMEFKDGAFRLAIETGADILPMAVCGTLNAWKTGKLLIGRAKGGILFGETIKTEGMTLQDLERLKNKSRDAVAELLEKGEHQLGLKQQ